MAAKAADEDHPFGHGRMEYISGLVISFIIMMMSIELGKSSFSKIFAHDKLSFSTMTFVINGDGTVNCLGRCSVLVAGIYGVALLQFFLLRE